MTAKSGLQSRFAFTQSSLSRATVSAYTCTMVSIKSNALLIASLLVITGCQSKPSSSAASVSAPLVLPMDVYKGPISLPSKEPALAPALGNADGHIKLVWLEQVSSTPKTHALMLSEFRDGVWGNTRKLYESPSIFANWADTPTVTTNPQGDTVVHWAEKSGTGTYAYDVRIGLIRDESFYVRRERESQSAR